MLGFIVRLVSGLCIGAPAGCIAYLVISLFTLNFILAHMLLAGLLFGFAAFLHPAFVISLALKSIVWNKI